MARPVSTFVAVASLLLTIASAVAQTRDTPRLFMAFLDYNAFHGHLVNRCASGFPDTAAPLRSAIAAWSRRNQPALEELRSLLREKKLGEGMAEQDVEAGVAQAAAKVTAFMIESVDHATQVELGRMCNEYGTQLARPDMDYAAFLQRLKSEEKR